MEDWFREMKMRVDWKEDGALHMPLKEHRFTDVYGTEHSVKVAPKHRFLNGEISVQLIERYVCGATKRLVKLTNPTTNGVQEVWVESSRLS